MHRIYLVRHGENPANLTKEFSHRVVDYPLTAKGVLQAQQTAATFRSRAIDAVYSSPLKRAQQTATIIADALGLPVIVLEEFREVNVGALELMPPTDEMWALHNSILRAWLAGNGDATFPSGENYHTLLARMRQGLLKVTAAPAPRNVVIVGHGGIFTMPIKDICPNVDLADVRSRPNHNCSISLLEARQVDGRLEATLIQWAAFDHLHGEAANLVPGSPEGKLK